jgi:hypothetical protein
LVAEYFSNSPPVLKKLHFQPHHLRNNNETGMTSIHKQPEVFVQKELECEDTEKGASPLV